MLRRLEQEIGDGYRIYKVTLKSNAISLYSTIHSEIGNSQPSALMILGLESVDELDDLLRTINHIRDEFRKRHPFPMVFWVNDELLRKLRRFAPDFTSWAATPIRFEMTTSELQNFLYTKTNSLFAKILDIGSVSEGEHPHTTLGQVWDYSSYEFRSSIKELQHRGIELEPELKASVQFIAGLDYYASNRVDLAIEYFQESLEYWLLTPLEAPLAAPTHAPVPPSISLLRQGVLLFYLGLSYYRLAERVHVEHQERWQEAKSYLQRCLDVFETARRPDLMAQIIGLLCDVLQHLKLWDELQQLALKSQNLHHDYGTHFQLACDSGFLAQVAIAKENWVIASKQARVALLRLDEASKNNNSQPISFPLLKEQIYRLTLAKALQHQDDEKAAMEHLKLACENLEAALENSDYRYEVYKYIRLLRWLRGLYFELGRYLEAFTIRQKRRSVEQQYGLRAFIGAGRLKPQRHATTPIVNSPAPSGSVALEIIASGRQRDVQNLIARISRPDQKLTVIHGHSGVGKSSTVTAGLVPALQQRAVGDQIAIPVVLQVYTDWVQELGKALSNAIALTKPLTIRKAALSEDTPTYPNTPITIDGVLELLRQNAQNNIITVLIFDQVEEFFSGCSKPIQIAQFDKFLCECMNVAFVKVILSLREDYLHKLLEFKYLDKVAPINENILDRSIRYQLKNFSRQDASSVIRELTQRSQYHIEPELIDALVDDLSAELGEVRPIELQVVGAQLQDERILTLAKYQQFRPNKLIERYLAELISDCGKENERAAFLVLYLLTDENKKRLFKTRAELAIELAELEDASKLELVLEILVRSGLVVLYPDVPERYQLIHDYLVDLIRSLQQTELSLQEQVKQLRAQVQMNEQEISRLESALRYNKQGKVTAEHQVTSSDLLSELKELRKRDELSRVERERLLSEIEQQKLQAELLETEKLRTNQARMNRLLKNALFASVLGILALTGSIWTAFSQGRKAVISASVAASASSEALFSLGKDIDALREGLRAARKIETAFLPDEKTQQIVRTALTRATYGMGVREINRLEGHLADVNSVVFSPDNSLIASASRDGTVILWKANGKKLHVLKGHSKRVNSVAFSPDSKMLVSGSSDKTVKLWSIDGRHLADFVHNEFVNTVAWAPDGKTIVSGGADNIIRLWNREGKELTTLRGHTLPVTSVAWAPDGSTIASTSSDKTVKLWSLSGKLLQTLKGHEDTVSAIAWAPNSSMLASTGWDKTIKLWSREGKLVNTIPAHKQVVMSVAFSPDGKTLASASLDKTVKLWNINESGEQPVDTLKGHSGWVTSVNFSSDGQTLASASRDTNIKLWRWKYLPLKSIEAHQKDVTMLSYSPKGDVIADSSKDGTVKIRNLDGKLLHSLTGHEDAVWDIGFSPDGQRIASASSDATVKLWSRNGKLLSTLEGHVGGVLSVDWAPSGKMLASAGRDSTIRLWSSDGKFIAKLIGHSEVVNWVSFSPDGEYIASASDDSTVKIWNKEGKLIKNITAHNRPVYAAVWSKDNILATVSLDSKVKLWDKNWNLVQTLNGEGEGFTSVSFSPDNQYIATMSEDKIKLWNRWGNLELVFNAEDDTFTTLSFTPDSKTLVTGNSKGKIVFRDLADTKTEKLMEKGCELLRDYLQNNTKVPENDRNLCP
jgi:WD40 repeat protein